MQIFRDAHLNEYSIPDEQKPMSQIRHIALWEYGPEGMQGWIITWDHYVIFGQPSGSQDTVLARFNQIDTVGKAMDAYYDFEGFPCRRCGHAFLAGHTCSG